MDVTPQPFPPRSLCRNQLPQHHRIQLVIEQQLQLLHHLQLRNLLMGTYSAAFAEFTAITGSTLVANSAARKLIFLLYYIRLSIPWSDLYCYFYIYAKTIKILLLLIIMTVGRHIFVKTVYHYDRWQTYFCKDLVANRFS